MSGIVANQAIQGSVSQVMQCEEAEGVLVLGRPDEHVMR
jgi:hypothetical protein